jgi:hypothetical protein
MAFHLPFGIHGPTLLVIVSLTITVIEVGHFQKTDPLVALGMAEVILVALGMAEVISLAPAPDPFPLKGVPIGFLTSGLIHGHALKMRAKTTGMSRSTHILNRSRCPMERRSLPVIRCPPRKTNGNIGPGFHLL